MQVQPGAGLPRPVPRAYRLPLLVLFAGMYAVTIAVVVSVTHTWDARSFGLLLLILLGLGFDLYAAWFVHHWRDWDETAPGIPALPSAGPPPSLDWSGRSVREGLGAIFFVVFSFLIIFLFEARSATAGASDVLFVWLLVPSLGIVAALLAVASRRRRLEIDDEGIRFHRPLLRDLRFQWAEIALVGLMTPGPKSTLTYRVGPPSYLLVFRGRDGRRMGALNVYGTLGLERAVKVVALIELQAKSRGIPVQEISPLDVLLWRRSRAPPVPP